MIIKRNFFIFGNNIKHSLSPALHNAGFIECGLPHHYAIHESPRVDDSVKNIIADPDFGGASVTYPHKLQVARLLDSISERAERQGKNGRRCLQGENTDCLGIQKCINKSGVSGVNLSPALILGAGGAALAACYAIRDKTVEKMAAHFPELTFHIAESLEDVLREGTGCFQVVVACIPADDLGEEKIPSALFSRVEEGVLVEMAYRPQITGMMKVASRYAGWKMFKGIDVLEEQAYSQFELWTGMPAPVAVMRKATLSHIH
ncbi:NAD(P)-binding protein [Thozetella sp. PMI_491]|nr:NAD(P)-binding protein [Thozetella sp. PMI_491]